MQEGSDRRQSERYYMYRWILFPEYEQARFCEVHGKAGGCDKGRQEKSSGNDGGRRLQFEIYGLSRKEVGAEENVST